MALKEGSKLSRHKWLIGLLALASAITVATVAPNKDEPYLFSQDGVEYDVYNLPKGFVIKGNLNLSGHDIDELPNLSSVTVMGSFICANTNITSLEGA
ncbi:MAG: hypothetical protein IKL32_07185, partial [Alphaproteobacteria bacterium]|nr:hypothetical protein [Alphaproteobacteria bacterium]